jgi:hypothetical protein
MWGPSWPLHLKRKRRVAVAEAVRTGTAAGRAGRSGDQRGVVPSEGVVRMASATATRHEAEGGEVTTVPAAGNAFASRPDRGGAAALRRCTGGRLDADTRQDDTAWGWRWSVDVTADRCSTRRRPPRKTRTTPTASRRCGGGPALVNRRLGPHESTVRGCRAPRTCSPLGRQSRHEHGTPPRHEHGTTPEWRAEAWFATPFSMRLEGMWRSGSYT